MLNEEKREDLIDIIEEVFSDYTETAGGKNYRAFHLKNVRKIALKLAKNVEENNIDLEVVEAAALFHDIGRAEDIEGGFMDPFKGHEGHDERGAKVLRDYIGDKFSDQTLSKIEGIIRKHHSEPRHIEGKIVQDADKISNFGVSNLWRQIHYSCQHEKSLEESIDYFWETAVNDFKNQIQKMHYNKSQEIAKNRLDRHKETVKIIQSEMTADDI